MCRQESALAVKMAAAYSIDLHEIVGLIWLREALSLVQSSRTLCTDSYGYRMEEVY
jgi:hypothetical protein